MDRNNLLRKFWFAIFNLLMIILSFNLLQAQEVPSLFVFGDSLVDVGNNNYLPFSFLKANFPHNGIDFPTKLPTGRFSNGKNAADFLAERVGLPSPPPYCSLLLKNNATSFLKGVNFASGGAGIVTESLQKLGQAISLTQQVDNYGLVLEELVQQLGPSRAQHQISKSLFVFVIGSNDWIHYYLESNLQRNNTPQHQVHLMFTTLKKQIERLYNNGSRKFLVAGVAQVGCTPSKRVENKTEECFEEMNYWCRKSNKRLKSMLQGLQSKLQGGFSYSFFDTYGAMQHMTQNPANYGFREVKAACCGVGKLNAEMYCLPMATYCSNRSEYLFWDKYHPTETAASFLADAIFDGPPFNHVFPINLWQLLAA